MMETQNEPSRSSVVTTAQAEQEQTLLIQGTSQAEQTSQAESISIKPSIAESERFIKFLNSRFSLGLRNDLIILIHETSPKMKGFFRSVKCSKIWNTAQGTSQATSQTEPSQENTAFKQQESQAVKPLNSIVLSSHSLKECPYETLAHETAHFINFQNGLKDCSGNQYHNKHFKSQAEKLLLNVERSKTYGYAFTSESQAFKDMLQEFKPSQDAFKVFQNTQEPKQKGKSRLLLYECECKCKIRTAKNDNKPLKAVCSYCNTEFKEVLK